MSKWESVVVEDIKSDTPNALVGGPFGSNLVSRDYVDKGIPVIRGSNMGQGRWVVGPSAYVSEEKASELSGNTARPGDLVFTQRGTLGQVCLVPQEPLDAYIISQSQMKLTVDRQKAHPLFVYYVFSSTGMQEYIRRNATQTGVPHINLGTLRRLQLPLPEMWRAHLVSIGQSQRAALMSGVLVSVRATCRAFPGSRSAMGVHA